MCTKSFTCLTLCGLLILSGCATFSSGGNRTDVVVQVPLEQKSKHLTGVALTAERRLILTKRGTNNVLVCAEPHPDVAEALVDIFRSNTQALLGNTELRADIATLLSTAPFSVFQRSQGVQFYRDSTFALCQMALNGWIETSRKPDISAAYYNALKKYYETYEAYGEYVKEQYKATGEDKTPELFSKPEPPLLSMLSKPEPSETNNKRKSSLPGEPGKPPGFLLSELEYALTEARKDAKEIILAEVEKKLTKEQKQDIENKLNELREKYLTEFEKDKYEALLQIIEGIFGDISIKKEINESVKGGS